MPLISLRCTSCSGEIKLDSNKEYGFCMHCGTKVVYKEALQHVNVKIEGIFSLNDLLQNADNFLKLCEFSKAEMKYQRIVEDYSYNPLGWWGLFCSKTFNCNANETFKQYGSESMIFFTKEANNAISLSDGELKSEIESKYDNFQKELRSIVSNNLKLKKEKESISVSIKSLEEEIKILEMGIKVLNKKKQRGKIYLLTLFIFTIISAFLFAQSNYFRYWLEYHDYNVIFTVLFFLYIFFPLLAIIWYIKTYNALIRNNKLQLEKNTIRLNEMKKLYQKKIDYINL